jgi:hypothetical protein
MEVSIESYRARIGTFVIKCIEECTTKICEEVVMGSQIWFMGQMIMALLVISGVELNPEPPADQQKIVHILEHVRKQKK